MYDYRASSPATKALVRYYRSHFTHCDGAVHILERGPAANGKALDMYVLCNEGSDTNYDSNY